MMLATENLHIFNEILLNLFSRYKFSNNLWNLLRKKFQIRKCVLKPLMAPTQFNLLGFIKEGFSILRNLNTNKTHFQKSC